MDNQMTSIQQQHQHQLDHRHPNHQPSQPSQDADSSSDTSTPGSVGASNNNNTSNNTDDTSNATAATPHVINKTKKKSKGRAFQCTAYPPCSMSFTRSEHLARHIRSHTGEKPFKCQHCQKNFSRLDNLRQHRQTVHAYENFILTYPNEKLMIRVRNDEFNEIKKNLGIDESNMVRVSYQEDEVDVAKQLSDLRNLPSPNPITPVTSQYNYQQSQSHHHHHHHHHNNQNQNQHPGSSILSPPNSTSPHNNSSNASSDSLPPPRPSASSSLLRPLQFRPDNNKRPRPIFVPPSSDDEASPQKSLFLSTPLSGRSLISPLSPYYNSQLHHMNYINNQLHPPSSTTPSSGNHVLSPYQQNFSQDIKDHKRLPLIKFKESQNGKQSPIVDENRYKMKVSNLMNDNNYNNDAENSGNNSDNSINTGNGNSINGQKKENGSFRLPSFKELDFK